ncbi:MAG: methyltransferase domain-containing protein [Thermoplasmata archaeon]
MVSRPGGRRPKPIRDHRRMEEAAWSRADAMAVLDSPERRASQDPDQLWRRLGLKPGETVVDVGAGSGFYAFPAAAVVGPSGRVYAVDVSPELVELVRERAANRKVRNVESVLSTPKRIPIEDAVADVAILANVLHGIPPKTVDETIRLLRPGGRLVDVDWKKEPTPEGPAVRHRLTAAEASATLSAHGLTPVDSFELGPYHYVLVFERPRPPRLPGHLVSAE